jgi:TorA maturation chaperone TorD
MRYEVNVTTGEIIEREPTAEELAQEAVDQAAAAAAKAEQDAAEAEEAATNQAEQTAKESARAKLAALGLTEEEIAAIIGE